MCPIRNPIVVNPALGTTEVIHERPGQAGQPDEELR